MKSLKILTEASGSLVSSYMIKAIISSGHQAIASDISPDCAGYHLASDFVIFPNKDDPVLWERIREILVREKIDLVIPSFDETLLKWAEYKEDFSQIGITIAISEPEIIDQFTDKWKTYCFFTKNNIPTPQTSLEQEFSLVKPRWGRGGRGIEITELSVNMDDMISQELIEGDEYTVDVFCDVDSHPVYIVPRKRINVRDGKSTQGIVEKNNRIEDVVLQICAATKFKGAINIQCFEKPSGDISVIEVNPRIAGGMALGFSATENWINLMEKTFIHKEKIVPKPIQYGKKMMRYYAEIFVP